MNSLNSVLIEGNLTRDPDLGETPKGTSVCNFAIASNRYYKQEEELQHEVSFFDVEVWSRLADACAEHLTKGRGVRIVGRLKQDRWQDPEGNPRSKVRIVGEHVEFKPIFKKKDDEASAQELEDAAGAPEEESSDMENAEERELVEQV